MSYTTEKEYLDEMIRNSAAAKLLGTSLVTLWRYSKNDPTFPKKIMLSKRCVGFRRGELLKWQESKMTG